MIKRSNYFDVVDYLDYQEKVLQQSPKTIDRKWAHLRHLLNWADDVPFPNVRKHEPVYPSFLLTARNDNQPTQLAPNTMSRACLEARSFFVWAKLHRKSKYGSIPDNWIDTIRPGRAKNVQSELTEREYFSLAEVRTLVAFSPKRLIDQRDRAATAFLFLSGMRISAFVTLPIKCVDLESGVVEQLPSEGVETKNSKAAKTFLLPIDDLVEVASQWHRYVKKNSPEGSYWYPNLSTDGGDLKVDEIGSSESRRMSFSRGLKRLCNRAGVEYKSPHKLRNGHGVFGVKQAKTVEEFKAFSQNMMHESMEITDRLYGRLARDDVHAAINRIGAREGRDSDEDRLYKDFLAFRKWLASQEG